jgi:hypothetical protein
MELPGSSSVVRGIAGRVRRLLLMDLSGCPGPSAETPGVRVFRAWRYWDPRGFPFVAATVGAFFLVLGGILIGLTRALP